MIECPFITFNIGEGGNGKTFLQMLTSASFGDLSTTVSLF